MMKKLTTGLIVLVIIIGQSISPLKAQQPGGLDGFSIKASGGALSFFGEVSDAGIAPLFDSKFGFTLAAIKMFNPWFGIQAQYLSGNTFGIKTSIGQYFEGAVSDFSLAARIEPLNLVESIDLGRITPYASLGLATLSYRAAKRDIGTRVAILPVFGYKTDGVTKAPKENGLAIPLSVGLSFQVTPSLAVELEHSQRFTNQDVLDATPGSSSLNDMFGLSSIGIRYFLQPKVSSGSPEFREARTKTRNNRNIQEQSDPVVEREQNLESEQIQSNTYNYELPLVTMFVERILPETVQSGKLFEVKLNINKGDYKGRAVLTQKFPSGFAAVESQPGYGRFEFVNQTAVVTWNQMPADSIVSYKYHVRTNENIAGSQTITGKIEYDQPDGIKSSRFNDYIFVDNNMEDQMDRKFKEIIGEEDNRGLGNELRGVNLENKTEEEIDTTLEELMAQYGGNRSTTTRKNPTTTKSNVVSAQSIPGREYRIQCGAFKDRREGGRKLANRFGITETLKEELHNGWYKYTVGSFKSYRDAERYRDSFIQRTKIWGAYIVAYQNGQRLRSVNQALR